ncbi:MAG: flagellar motor switch protein FliG [Gammaproteobacteria bacterium HGW-Gammaproteobacteria-1]|jgi:flagellar motor switch protein FliG|nr:MAG: flagellar motor switch protein FliG [Gammaproteobacteria bacterium HGW-Gammaproteobacteria-1]
MAEKKAKLNGPERAAILMMALGEEVATAIMKHMGPKEVQRIGEAMASTSNVSRDQVEDVVSNFAETFGDQTALGVGSEEYLRKILVNSLGEDKAAGLIDRILLGRSSKGLEALKWMEPRSIAEVVRLEHPQIIAIVLSYLDADQAAEVLSLLPENMRADILMRIASLDGIQPSALQELDDILEKQFSGSSGNLKSSSVGGTKTAANILNFMDTAVEGAIIDKVKEVDGELGQKIQDLMFVFDNLAEVDDRSIQALLREVSSDTLIIALKGADAAVTEKVLKNMSKRAAEMLRDDLEARGPVRLSEVESAQKEILAIARRMAESGDISLGGGGDEFV